MTRRNPSSPNGSDQRSLTFTGAMDRLKGLRSGAEQAVLLAALRWANLTTGLLWPAVESWAEMAGIAPRSLRRTLRTLEAKGDLTLVCKGGGRRKAATYQLNALRENPDRGSGFSDAQTRPVGPPTRTVGSQTRTVEVKNPDPRSGEQQGTDKEPTTTGGVVEVGVLSQEMLRHPNATAERVAWVRREAPQKWNPAGWAAEAIRKGWDPPPPSEAEKAASRRLASEEKLAKFNAMPADQRATLIAAARRQFPNLDGHADDSRPFLGAVLKVMAEGRTP